MKQSLFTVIADITQKTFVFDRADPPAVGAQYYCGCGQGPRELWWNAGGGDLKKCSPKKVLYPNCILGGPECGGEVPSRLEIFAIYFIAFAPAF